jgi:hypothetical protein
MKNNYKYLIPISNFAIEEIYKTGDVYYTPSINVIEFCDYKNNDSVSDEEFEIIKEYLTIFNNEVGSKFDQYTLAITEFKMPEGLNPQEDFAYTNRICEKVDRNLDYLRLRECQIGNVEQLPGLPGIMDDGFKNAFYNVPIVLDT